MATPLTIIVPTYNVEQFLSQCLSSIKKQAFQDFECLIVDDGSSDQSIQISNSFCTNDNRFHLIKCQHHSLANVQNVGLQYAHGEYITFCDGDDFVSPTGYQKVMKIAMQQYPDLIISNFCKYYNDTKHEVSDLNMPTFMNQTSLISKFPQLYQQNFMFYDWNKIYKRSLISKTRFQNLTVGLDTIFNYELFQRCQSLVFNKEQYYFYRQRLGSLVNHYDPQRLKIRKLETKALSQLLKQWHVNYREELLTRDWFTSLSLCIKNLYLPDSPLSSIQRLKMIHHLLEECLPHINNNYLTSDEEKIIANWQTLKNDNVLQQKWQKVNAKYFHTNIINND